MSLEDLPTVQSFMVENGGVEVNSVKLTWTALSIPEDIKYALTRTGSASTVTLNKDIEMHTFDSLTAGQEYTFTIAVSLDSVTGTQESVTTYTSKLDLSDLDRLVLPTLFAKYFEKRMIDVDKFFCGRPE